MTRLQQFIRISISIFVCFCAVAHAAHTAPDAEEPVQIIADYASFDQKNGVATYTGHVTVTQGSRILHANKLTIHRDKDNRVNLMIATGKPATFKAQDNKDKPPGSGKANTIKYYPQSNKVDLIDNASLTQNGDTVSGSKLTYNFATEELQSKSNQQQRTTVILQPKRVP